MALQQSIVSLPPPPHRMPEAKSVADRIEVAVRMLRTAGARDVVVGLMIGLHTFPGFQAMCPGDLPALEAASLECVVGRPA
jgi:hypothetical protein